MNNFTTVQEFSRTPENTQGNKVLFTVQGHQPVFIANSQGRSLALKDVWQP